MEGSQIAKLIDISFRMKVMALSVYAHMSSPIVPLIILIPRKRDLDLCLEPRHDHVSKSPSNTLGLASL